MDQSVVERPNERILVEKVFLPYGKRFRFSCAQVIDASGGVAHRVSHDYESLLALFLLVIVPGLALLSPESLVGEDGLVEEFDRPAVTAAWK